MKNISPDKIADKWVNNLSAATNAITAGVQAVTQSPTEKAAERADAYIAGVQAAVTSGKWQRNLRAVTLEMWKQAMIQKGVPIIAQRAQQAKAKYQRFIQAWMSYQRNIQSALQSMPRGTLEQNIQRCNYVIRANAAWGKGGELLPAPMMGP